MRSYLLTILAVFLLLAPVATQATTTTNQFITINLPGAVIAEAIKHVLPLSLNRSSSRLEGTITIVNISNFQIKDQQILCHLDLMGNNLQLVTTVANQSIRLQLGSARIDFDFDADIRFDRTRQTLYIRPMARGVQGSDPLSNGDIGQALLLLFNGQEFPITMQDLKPIVARANSKIITIKTHIVDIRAMDGALQLSLSPVITASPLPKKSTQPTVQ